MRLSAFDIAGHFGGTATCLVRYSLGPCDELTPNALTLSRFMHHQPSAVIPFKAVKVAEVPLKLSSATGVPPS